MDSKMRNYIYFAPKFVWLLRDCEHEVNIEGDAVTEAEYLEHVLKPRQSSCDDAEGKNATRISFNNFFTNRTLFTLSHPRISQKKLNDENISEEFVKSVEALKSYIKRSSVVKFFQKDGIVEGSGLAAICKSSIILINGVAAHMKHFKWSRNKGAFEMVVNDYNGGMRWDFNTGARYDTKEFERKHSIISKNAIEKRFNGVILDPNGIIHNILKKEMQNLLNVRIRENNELWQNNWLYYLESHVYSWIRKGEHLHADGYEDYLKRISDAEKSFMNQESYIVEEQVKVLRDFEKSSYCQIQDMFVRKLCEAKKKEKTVPVSGRK